MDFHQNLGAASLLAASLLVIAGCATTMQKETYQFKPAPVASIGAEDLDPVRPRTEWELMKAANEAFKAANVAQEANDQEGALRHYTRMLELLIEADLDPNVYYNLREEFERILQSSAELAKSTEDLQLRDWSEIARQVPRKSSLPYPQPMNDRVLAEIKAIQNGYAKNFQAGLNRSAKYIPYIREELRKAGLPQDLAWLAMVESQFTPRIDSRVGAGGMWQFMKGTGRRYGLHIDYYVDERYDWRKATHAAIAYLSDLYQMFDGNWPMAVSAYNKGEFGIERAITAAGGEKDLWRLMEHPAAQSHLPLETKKFYARLLASAIVAHNPEKYGFKRPVPASEPVTYAKIEGSYSLAELERSAELPKGALRSLNPQFLQGVTPPDRTSEVAVPQAQQMKLAAALQQAPTLRPGTHVVRRGETVSAIAKRYNVSPDDLMRANKIRSAKNLQAGQRLAIPGVVIASDKSDATTNIAQHERTRVASGTTYTVKKGDSLSGIATRHGVSIADLQRWNNLGRNTEIFLGDTLFVSSDDNAVVLAASATDAPATKHKVAPGESPSVIAAKYAVDTNQLLAWNKLAPDSVLYAGSVLVVYPQTPAQTSNDEASAARRVEHVVASGQNPTSIANRYGVALKDLFSWNGWKKSPVLHVGERVVVYTD